MNEILQIRRLENFLLSKKLLMLAKSLNSTKTHAMCTVLSEPNMSFISTKTRGIHKLLFLICFNLFLRT